MTYERSGGGKVICPLCRYTWTTEAALAAHLQKPHRPCPECGRLFVGLNQHLSYHRGRRPRGSPMRA